MLVHLQRHRAITVEPLSHAQIVRNSERLEISTRLRPIGPSSPSSDETSQVSRCVAEGLISIEPNVGLGFPSVRKGGFPQHDARTHRLVARRPDSQVSLDGFEYVLTFPASPMVNEVNERCQVSEATGPSCVDLTTGTEAGTSHGDREVVSGDGASELRG